jgi:cytochrome c556
MKAMNRLADEMKALARLIKSRETSTEEIARRSRVVRDLSRNTASMFPPGTDKDPHTEARATVWQNRSEFEELAQRSESRAAELVQAAEQADRTKVRQSFTALTQSCGACHERFREKRHRH